VGIVKRQPLPDLLSQPRLPLRHRCRLGLLGSGHRLRKPPRLCIRRRQRVQDAHIARTDNSTARVASFTASTPLRRSDCASVASAQARLFNGSAHCGARRAASRQCFSASGIRSCCRQTTPSA